MKQLLLVASAVFALSCWETEKPPGPPITGISCGAVVARPGGNADLLLFIDLARLKALIRKPFQVQPQIIVWEPSRWAAGSTLKVKFLDGDAASRTFVIGVAREWLTGLNLKFAESSDANADIRITFTGKGVWAAVGMLAQSVANGQPTMGLAALIQTNDPDLRRAYVLHEFGHALGALHEHQRRDAPLTWKPDVVYAYYLDLYGWDKLRVDAEVILPFQYEPVVSSPQFDRMSVMMYPIQKEFTEEQFVQSWNSQLTAWDRSVMAQLYP